MALDDNGGGSGAAAEGGAADILTGGGAAAAAADGGGSAAQGGDGAGVAAGADVAGAIDPDWYANLSAEGGDGDNPSNRDWIKSVGIKDLDGLAKIARDNQKALRDSGRVKLPGEGAPADEVAAFRKAIGVPDDAKGYAIAAPKDADGNDVPLDDTLIGLLSESALKAGLPKAGFEAVVGDFIKAQLDQAADFDARQKTLAAETVKGWGSESATKLAAVDAAARALDLDRDKLVALRGALGADFALNMLAKLGGGMQEDVLLTGGKGRFGISGPEAKAEIDRLTLDVDFQKKVKIPNSPERVRWNRLNDAHAEYEAKQQAA